MERHSSADILRTESFVVDKHKSARLAATKFNRILADALGTSLADVVKSQTVAPVNTVSSTAPGRLDPNVMPEFAPYRNTSAVGVPVSFGHRPGTGQRMFNPATMETRDRKHGARYRRAPGMSCSMLKELLSGGVPMRRSVSFVETTDAEGSSSSLSSASQKPESLLTPIPGYVPPLERPPSPLPDAMDQLAAILDLGAKPAWNESFGRTQEEFRFGGKRVPRMLLEPDPSESMKEKERKHRRRAVGLEDEPASAPFQSGRRYVPHARTLVDKEITRLLTDSAVREANCRRRVHKDEMRLLKQKIPDSNAAYEKAYALAKARGYLP